MLSVSTGKHGVANNNDRIRSGITGEDGQARKKARCEVSESPGAKGSHARVSKLRVDVNASRLASPGRVPGVRRSPIAAFDHHVGDGGIAEETSDAGTCKSIGLRYLVFTLLYKITYFLAASHFKLRSRQ